MNNITSNTESMWSICKRRVRIDTPTPEQVERGLTSKSASERYAWAKLSTYIPTLMQIERGLADVHVEIREIWTQRDLDMDKGIIDISSEEELYLLSNDFTGDDFYCGGVL